MAIPPGAKMSCFAEHFWGDKNHGFDVLYHNMKHGQISTKELADFVRERAVVEETYAKSMGKLSKMAANSTQLGTFAPLWEVFRISSDKLALCHQELVRKLQELIREIGRYGEEQLRAHKKSKEEVSGTLEAVQALQTVAQLLPKAKENYHGKCQELERLRREGASQKEVDKAELKSKKAAEALRCAIVKYNVARDEFEHRMLESAMRFQELEESHLRSMKGLIGSYAHSVEDTHVQIGQVHEEFKQNVENIGAETLLHRFAESKGTGRRPPGALDFEEYSTAPPQEGPKRSRSKAFRIPGLGRKERERDSVESPDADSMPPDVDEEGFTVRPDTNPKNEPGSRCCSSSDSDYDENDEPRKFYVHIKPVQPRDNAVASVEQLKATVGSLILPPGPGGTVKRHSSRHSTSLPPNGDAEPPPGEGSRHVLTPHPAVRAFSCGRKPRTDVVPSQPLFGPPLESPFETEDFSGPRPYILASSPSPFSSSSPENVEDSGLDSPSHAATGPSPDSRPWTPRPGTPQSPLSKRHTRGSPASHGERPALPAADAPSPWLSQPDPRDTPCFLPEPPQGDPAWPPGAPPREAPSPDPFFPEGRASTPHPWAPGSERPPQARERDACPSSNSASSSSSSPAPPSSGDSSSPSPWTLQVPSTRDMDNGTASTPEPPSDPDPSPLPGLIPVVAPPRRCRTKRPSPVPAVCRSSDTVSGAPTMKMGRGGWRNRARALFLASRPRAPSFPGNRAGEGRAPCGGAVPPFSVPAFLPQPRSLSPSPLWTPAPPTSAGLSQRGFFTAVPPALGVSRGPSPVVLGSHDALPVATAFTEYVHAYFKGCDPDSCLVKVTGELTMSFPAGILRVFSSCPAPPVLSFRLLHVAPIDQFLPNAELLYSDPSQSDPSAKDFWLNMTALTGHLQNQAEQTPTASYYNVPLLKYQFSKLGPSWAPLRLAVRWECGSEATRVCVEYGYNARAMAAPVPLTNVQVLLPVEEPVTNVRLQPAASWNLEEKRLLWRLLDVPGDPGHGGCGRLSASWDPLHGPSKPSPVAAQFTSEGSTLSGVEVELVGSGYRMSLVKKRFATGIYLAGS